MDRMSARTGSGVLLVSTLAFGVAFEANAEPFSVSIRYEAEATDNVRRTADDTRDDIVHRPQLQVGYEQAFNRVELSADYLLELRRYQRNTFSSEEVVSGRSEINVSLLPARLNWVTDHVRSETLVDRREADRPDNRRESNTLGTGLIYVIGAGSINQLTTRVRGELFSSDRGFDDSTRYSGSVAYQRLLSDVQNIGLTADILDVDFDDDRVPDYRRSSARVTYGHQLRTIGLDLGVGYNLVSRSGLEDRDGLFLSVDAFWQPVEVHRFNASLSRQFTDRTLATVRGIPEFGEFRDQGTEDGNVFEQTRASIGYRYTGGQRWTFGLSADATDEDFDLGRDQRIYGARMTVDFRVSQSVTTDFIVRGERRDFRDEGRTDDLLAADLRLRWVFRPTTSMSLSAGYQERDSDDGVFGDYVERRIIFSIAHQLL